MNDANVIVEYTIEQAVADGIMLDIRKVSPKCARGIFSHVTTNLLASGDYLNKDGTLNLPNLLDLLNQSLEIVRRKKESATKDGWLFDGEVEFPSGRKQKVWIARNEVGKFTILLPEDY